MKLFYIKAKVSISVFGISGESQEGVSRLVNANDERDAVVKFENHCKLKFAKMQFEKIRFEYLEIAPSI